MAIAVKKVLVRPVKTIKKMFPQKRVIVFFPPNRFSAALKAVADFQLSIGHGLLAKCQFPDKVVKADGYVLQRPLLWR
ncbi:MAG: hypothetical protein NTW93_01205 [Phycisphaerae bacterium]|nr:hypothetical protein [Phycisphaerae bacterium]